MAGDVGDGVHPPHAAIGSDEERDALRVAGVVGVVGVVEGRRDLAGIAQQPERVGELLGEGAVGRDVVEADPQDLAVACGEVAGSITEPVALDRSTRGVGLRVEPQEHVRAREVREADRGPVVRGQLEIGREVSGGGAGHGASIARNVCAFIPRR